MKHGLLLSLAVGCFRGLCYCLQVHSLMPTSKRPVCWRSSGSLRVPFRLRVPVQPSRQNGCHPSRVYFPEEEQRRGPNSCGCGCQRRQPVKQKLLLGCKLLRTGFVLLRIRGRRIKQETCVALFFCFSLACVGRSEMARF